MILFLLTFFYFGAIFWSFSTVLIERWHSWKWWIINGRSECPHCNNVLKVRDLFPIFSYIWNKWKCSFCDTHISIFYLKAEIIMGIIFMTLAFAGVYIWLDIYSSEFVLLLLFGFVTGVYILYDIQYMEIPDQIMVPAILMLLIIPFLSVLFTGYNEYTFHTFPISLFDRLKWAWILYTFFYIQILIPGWYFFIKNKQWKHLWEITVSYITFPLAIIVEFFRKKKHEEEIEVPTWVWWGDLRIALFIWLTLGTIHGIASFAIAYIVGSIVWICILILNAIRRKKTKSQIPFGPFLWFGWIMGILLYTQIDDIITMFIYNVN